MFLEIVYCNQLNDELRRTNIAFWCTAIIIVIIIIIIINN